MFLTVSLRSSLERKWLKNILSLNSLSLFLFSPRYWKNVYGNYLFYFSLAGFNRNPQKIVGCGVWVDDSEGENPVFFLGKTFWSPRLFMVLTLDIFQFLVSTLTFRVGFFPRFSLPIFCFWFWPFLVFKHVMLLFINGVMYLKWIKRYICF